MTTEILCLMAVMDCLNSENDFRIKKNIKKSVKHEIINFDICIFSTYD